MCRGAHSTTGPNRKSNVHHQERPKVDARGCTFPAGGHDGLQAVNSDNFKMYSLKVVKCTDEGYHDWAECPFAHSGEAAARRDPRHHAGIVCPDIKKTSHCSRGEKCPFAHNTFEYWLHPTRYRTKMCMEGKNCQRRFCFFAHAPEELRQPEHPPQQRVQRPQSAAKGGSSEEEISNEIIEQLSGMLGLAPQDIKTQLQGAQDKVEYLDELIERLQQCSKNNFVRIRKRGGRSRSRARQGSLQASAADKAAAAAGAGAPLPMQPAAQAAVGAFAQAAAGHGVIGTHDARLPPSGPLPVRPSLQGCIGGAGRRQEPLHREWSGTLVDASCGYGEGCTAASEVNLADVLNQLSLQSSPFFSAVYSGLSDATWQQDTASYNAEARQFPLEVDLGRSYGMEFGHLPIDFSSLGGQTCFPATVPKPNPNYGNSHSPMEAFQYSAAAAAPLPLRARANRNSRSISLPAPLPDALVNDALAGLCALERAATAQSETLPPYALFQQIGGAIGGTGGAYGGNNGSIDVLAGILPNPHDSQLGFMPSAGRFPDRHFGAAS